MTEYAQYRSSAVHLAEFDALTRGVALEWAKRTPMQRMFIRAQIAAEFDRRMNLHGRRDDKDDVGIKLGQAIIDALALANIDRPETFAKKDRVGSLCVTWFVRAFLSDFWRVDRRNGHHVAALREHFDVMLEIVTGDRGAIDFNEYLAVLRGGPKPPATIDGDGDGVGVDEDDFDETLDPNKVPEDDDWSNGAGPDSFGGSDFDDFQEHGSEAAE